MCRSPPKTAVMSGNHFAPLDLPAPVAPAPTRSAPDIRARLLAHQQRMSIESQERSESRARTLALANQPPSSSPRQRPAPRVEPSRSVLDVADTSSGNSTATPVVPHCTAGCDSGALPNDLIDFYFLPFGVADLCLPTTIEQLTLLLFLVDGFASLLSSKGTRRQSAWKIFQVAFSAKAGSLLSAN